MYLFRILDMKYYNSNSKFLVQRSSTMGPLVQKYMNYDDFMSETLILQFQARCEPVQMLFNFDVQANPGGAPQLCLRWKEFREQKGEDGNSKSKNKRGNTCSSSTMCWGYWPPLHDIKRSLIHLKLLKTHHIICNPMWCRSIAKGKMDPRVDCCFQSNKFYKQA